MKIKDIIKKIKTAKLTTVIEKFKLGNLSKPLKIIDPKTKLDIKRYSFC